MNRNTLHLTYPDWQPRCRICGARMPDWTDDQTCSTECRFESYAQIVEACKNHPYQPPAPIKELNHGHPQSKTPE